MDQGDCFFNKPTPSCPSHPWVIVSYPPDDPDNVLIVNLTDIENHHDHSCVLQPEDHPGVFIKKCCIKYEAAKVTSVKLLEQAFAQGLLYLKNPVPPETLDKIIEGAIETDELINAHRMLLRRQGIIP